MATVRGDMNATLKDLTLIAESTTMEQQRLLHPLICSSRPEDGAYTRIPIQANLPFPRKFEGERSNQGKDVTVVQAYSQDTYELTIELDSDLIKNAKAYDQADIVREATMSAVQFPSYLASQAVIKGNTTLAYDAVNFYGTTHKYAKTGTNSINNTVAKTGGSVPALATDLASVLSALRTFKDNQGRLLNPQVSYGASKLLIHAPAALEQNFRTLLNSNWIPITVPVTTSGTAAAPAGFNAMEGIADLYVDGYLDADSATAWYCHYVGMPQRPFVFLENYGLQVQVLGFGSEHEVKTNKVLIALKQRFVLGYYRFDRSVKVS